MPKSSYELVSLKKFSFFDSIQEMDHTVRTYNKELKKSLYETLNFIKQHSCKIVGISHLKYNTIANKLGKSKSTIRRHIKELTENGFITVISIMRNKTGGYGANAFAINSPVQRRMVLKSKTKNEHSEMNTRNKNENDHKTIDKPDFSKVLISKQTIKSLKLYKTFKVAKSSESEKRNENIKNYRECPNDVPKDIYMTYKPFFTDKQIATLYTIILDNIIEHELSAEQDEMIIDECFRSLLRKIRNHHQEQGDKVKNMFAYIKGAAKNIAELYRGIKTTKTAFTNVNSQENSNLQSIEMTPEWLPKFKEKEEMKAFNQENESLTSLKNKFLTDLMNELKATYTEEELSKMKKQWLDVLDWNDESIEALTTNRDLFMKEQLKHAEAISNFFNLRGKI